MRFQIIVRKAVSLQKSPAFVSQSSHLFFQIRHGTRTVLEKRARLLRA